MREFFWRLRAAFWYWWKGCYWHEVRAAWVMATALEYIKPGDDFYQTPSEAVATDISYWEP